MAYPVSKFIHNASEFIDALENPDVTDNALIRFCEASVETWLEILNHSEDAAKWVAFNKTIPVEVIAVLAIHESAQIRSLAAAKNRITPELILVLSTDPDESVRSSIAYHKKTGTEVLRNLLHDDSEQIVEKAKKRLGALEHTST